MIVAQAAPCTPHPNEMMKMASSSTFTPLQIRVAYSGLLVSPSPLNTPYACKTNTWVTTFSITSAQHWYRTCRLFVPCYQYIAEAFSQKNDHNVESTVCPDSERPDQASFSTKCYALSFSMQVQ